MPFGKKKSTEADRIAWLRAHPEVWESVKLRETGSRSRPICASVDDHRRVAAAMKKAGLYAPSTYALDITVPAMIDLIRRAL